MTAVPAVAPVLAVGQPYYPLNSFGFDVWWIMLLKVVVIFAFLMVTTVMMIWAERRIIGRMQQRPGPNRVGPFGMVQGLADGIKLMLKEDIIPAMADKPVYFLAPIISVMTAFLGFAVIPVGGVVSIGDHQTALQITDLPVAVLYVLAASSFGVYGIVLGGWASGSTYPLLGGLRSSAQVISYEIAMGLSLVTVFLNSGSLSTSQIVAAQDHGTWLGWNFLPLFPAVVIYAVAAVGETNRAPFDLPEAEGELVGGFHTEYSSIKFAMFFLAEYVNMSTVAAMGTTLFLGGWLPPPIPGIAGLVGWWGILWFAIKFFAIMFLFIWVRGTLPRYRYDQFMKLGWKVLVPFALIWLVVVAAVRNSNQHELITIGLPLAVVAILVAGLWPSREPSDAPETGYETSGRFPVPSLDALAGSRAPGPLAMAGAPAGATAGGSFGGQPSAAASFTLPGDTLPGDTQPGDTPAGDEGAAPAEDAQAQDAQDEEPDRG